MKINEKHLYHGAALAQIVEHASFKALNKAPDGAYGHYILNQGTALWMKYATGEPEWQFTFNPTDLVALRGDPSAQVLAVLVCGQRSVCLLHRAELVDLIDLSAASSQWLRIGAPAGTGLKVRGQQDPTRAKTIPHNRFPNELF